MSEAIATGTVIYVIFFEIFPKAKDIGGTGFQHVISMLVGFAIFLPSLLLRKYYILKCILTYFLLMGEKKFQGHKEFMTTLGSGMNVPPGIDMTIGKFDIRDISVP